MFVFDGGKGRSKKRNFAPSADIQQAGFQGVVQVRGVVGNFVNVIDELGFERGTQVEKVLRKLGEILRADIRANASRCLRALRRLNSDPGKSR